MFAELEKSSNHSKLNLTAFLDDFDELVMDVPLLAVSDSMHLCVCLILVAHYY